MKLNKNIELLTEFTEYCNEHPKQRFWVALLNFTGVHKIFVEKKFRPDAPGDEYGDDFDLLDTYYFNEKDH